MRTILPRSNIASGARMICKRGTRRSCDVPLVDVVPCGYANGFVTNGKKAFEIKLPRDQALFFARIIEIVCGQSYEEENIG
nr:hypothetical protein Iba_chr12dCG12490 [Ipomoea batatas]GMD68778.1 hypothetical protein Iba_chr12dCG12500 [Ipomoea batatas]